jgi:hypothetical protein
VLKADAGVPFEFMIALETKSRTTLAKVHVMLRKEKLRLQYSAMPDTEIYLGRGIMCELFP